MPNNPNFLNAWGSGGGASPVGPINPQTPMVLTPQQHAILQVLAQHMAANIVQQPGTPAAAPSHDPSPAQPQHEVVRHPNAPARLPYVIRNSQTGGYVTGGSPLFPRLFATKAEAKAAIPSQETEPTKPGAMPAIGLSEAGGAVSQAPAAGPPHYEVRLNSDAPARFPYGHWDNQTQDWARDRFGFAKMFGAQAEANENLPKGMTPAVVQLASNTHPAQASQTAPAKPPQYEGSNKQSTSQEGGQYTINGLSSNPEFGGDYRKVIINAAHQYGLDPRALQAIIFQETKGNPSMVNYNTNGTIDYGMMQVNSGTRDPNSYNWRDPSTGIYAGAQVFAGKLKQAHGNYREAFRRYNGAGPAAEHYGQTVYGYYKGLGGGKP